MESLEYKFNFKSRAIVDTEGNVVGRTKKPESLICAVPVPSPEEIAQLVVKGDAVAKLITSAVATAIIEQARGQFNDTLESFGDDDTRVLTADVLDFSKLTLEYIASIPPTQRGAAAITDDEWKFFFTDYVAVMMAATGKDATVLGRGVDLFKKPQKTKGNKPVLTKLIEMLDIYMANTTALEDTAPAASRLRNKFQSWNDAEEVVTGDML